MTEFDGSVLWPVIERVLDGEAPTRAMFPRMSDAATALTNDELVDLDAQWTVAFRALDKPELHNVASDVLGGCGDDRFLDVRAWLIAHGRETYERVLSDPSVYRDLPEPDPAWESGELTERYAVIGVDRGVFPAWRGREATTAPRPIVVPKRRKLPWRIEGSIYVDGLQDWVADVHVQLVETGRFEGTVCTFVVEEGEPRTVRFEPSSALHEAIPYGSVEGDEVDARLFSRLLMRLDGEEERGRLVPGVGWFGNDYLGLDEEGGDRWELGFVPCKQLLLIIGVPDEQILPDPGPRWGPRGPRAKPQPEAPKAKPPKPKRPGPAPYFDGEDDDPPKRTWWQKLMGW